MDAPLGSTVHFAASIGLFVYIPSTNTGMSGAAGEYQPAAAKPACTNSNT